jgi:hypothetical protein
VTWVEYHVSMTHLSRLSGFRCGGLVACCLALLSCSEPAAAPPAPKASAPKASAPYVGDAFWSHWGDGQAEIATYDLAYPRYGTPRAGVAVTIFVAESFSQQARVKADPGKHPDADVFPVMKLNLIEDFQTGIYDYNEQTSSFLALAANAHQSPGYLTKVSFSSQEWCGHSWAQWVTQPAGLQYSGHSYFDGEADRSQLIEKPDGGITEEQLMFWARGMAEPKLQPGEERTVPFRRSLQQERHSHREASWLSAKLSRSAASQKVSVPAGQFEAETWRAELPDGPVFTFLVEAAVPHRILEWSTSEGERAVLVKSDRLKYWEMNKPGGENGLSRLGLQKRSPRTP